MVNGKAAAFWVTLILIGFFGICFFLNMFTIRLSRQIEEFVIVCNKNNEASNTFQINSVHNDEESTHD
jgi:hypothetical protein